jgi:hypothetical protein
MAPVLNAILPVQELFEVFTAIISSLTGGAATSAWKAAAVLLKELVGSSSLAKLKPGGCRWPCNATDPVVLVASNRGMCCWLAAAAVEFCRCTAATEYIEGEDGRCGLPSFAAYAAAALPGDDGRWDRASGSADRWETVWASIITFCQEASVT